MPLAGTPPRNHFDDRERHDLQVGEHPAVGDVLEVTANHPVEVGVVAVCDLPPSGDAGLHDQAL